MKQLTTIKHIIFVVLLLVIILSLFGGNTYDTIKEGLECSEIKNMKRCDKYNQNGCSWYKGKCQCDEQRSGRKHKPCVLG
jgi:hypothetical protein